MRYTSRHLKLQLPLDAALVAAAGHGRPRVRPVVHRMPRPRRLWAVVFLVVVAKAVGPLLLLLEEPRFVADRPLRGSMWRRRR